MNNNPIWRHSMQKMAVSKGFALFPLNSNHSLWKSPGVEKLVEGAFPNGPTQTNETAKGVSAGNPRTAHSIDTHTLGRNWVAVMPQGCVAFVNPAKTYIPEGGHLGWFSPRLLVTEGEREVCSLWKC